MRRRAFLQVAAAGSAVFLGAGRMPGAYAGAGGAAIISPGCRKSKVRVAKVYMGIPNALWPTPKMDLNAEVQRYEAEFAKRGGEFADVEFVVSELVTSPDQAKGLQDKLKDVDGILAIHLSMGITGALKELLAAGKPTMLFAAPYSGHEWTGFGGLMKQPDGGLLDCMLTGDFDQLAVAVRPFRAIHHLREAIILNATLRELPADYVKAVKDKFGTEIKRIDRDQVLDAYNAVDDGAAEAETKRWMDGAEKVVEPSREEVFRSCKLALAFEKLLNDADATVITVECYGSMYRQLPAFPCIGFTRLNDMGLGGICESDLSSAMTFVLLQSLSGKPGFISDPTVDESTGSIILAHCLGSTRMDGPQGEVCPYKLRCIMERQEGAVAQVRMRLNQKVTQAELIGTDRLQYFTGEIIEVPDIDRGCRTKITVKVDGDIDSLWKNWSHGLHRVTCYGDVTKDLKRFCRFKGIQMIDEAQPAPEPLT
jgi:hypothetical protein